MGLHGLCRLSRSLLAQEKDTQDRGNSAKARGQEPGPDSAEMWPRKRAWAQVQPQARARSFAQGPALLTHVLPTVLPPSRGSPPPGFRGSLRAPHYPWQLCRAPVLGGIAPQPADADQITPTTGDSLGAPAVQPCSPVVPPPPAGAGDKRMENSPH